MIRSLPVGILSVVALVLVACGSAASPPASPTPAQPSVTVSQPSLAPSPVATPTVSAVAPSPTLTPRPPSPGPATPTPLTPTAPTALPLGGTPTTTTKLATSALTVQEIAATAVAAAQGEQCVAAGPKPAKGFVGNPTRGKLLFSDRGCSACHGEKAQGGVGPRLAGITLPFPAVIKQLREPRGVMQRYLPADQSDADECDVYVYLQTLK